MTPEHIGIVRDRSVHLVAPAVGVIEPALRPGHEAFFIGVRGRLRFGIQIVESPPAGVFHLGERVRVEQVPELGEPHVFGRVFPIRQRVVRDERRDAGTPDDVVGVILNMASEVVVRVRLPRQLEIEPRADFVALRHAACRVGFQQETLRAREEEQLVFLQRPAELRRNVRVLLGSRGICQVRVFGRDILRHVGRSQALGGAEEIEQPGKAIAA